MQGNIKIIGSNNKYLPLGGEYRGDLIANKLIVNSREENTPIKVFTLDTNNVTIYDKHVHVDAWFVDEESNGGRMEMELYWT
tara:strand:- start:790 stop:1035 length:246 start_codon:yes stop_codon:yes gene_type:complete